MTTQTLTASQDHPQRRPYHLLAGSFVFVVAYAFVVAFVRVALMPR